MVSDGKWWRGRVEKSKKAGRGCEHGHKLLCSSKGQKDPGNVHCPISSLSLSFFFFFGSQRSRTHIHIHTHTHTLTHTHTQIHTHNHKVFFSTAQRLVRTDLVVK